MTAGIHNFRIEQGTTWSRTLRLSQGTPAVALDLTGYTARSSIRKAAHSTVALADITCNIADPTVGTLELSLTAVQTAALPADGGSWDEPSRYAYDVEIVDPDGKVTRLLNGAILVSPEVTR